jgi:hypothetical protein
MERVMEQYKISLLHENLLGAYGDIRDVHRENMWVSHQIQPVHIEQMDHSCPIRESPLLHDLYLTKTSPSILTQNIDRHRSDSRWFDTM